LHGLPLYNEDEDEEARAGIGARSAFGHREADGVNHGSPETITDVRPSLKNALDGPPGLMGRSVLGQAGTDDDGLARFTGGVRAQQQMNETLASIPARSVLSAPDRDRGRA